VQSGDTAETILRRADRALYQAKDQGRNRVIQLGVGASDDKPVRRWLFWRRNKPSSPEILAEENMIAPGPIRFALDKLRGFVADYQAVIKRAEENMLEFELVARVRKGRRKSDLGQTFLMRLRFWEEAGPRIDLPGNMESELTQIRINVVVSLESPPARIEGWLTDYARRVIRGLRAYLMAKMVLSPNEDKQERRSKKALLPRWTDS
jgi:hypothetical protein